MQNPPLIFAVTVNYNHPQDTIDCLASLIQQKDVLLRNVVIDNGSEDDSVLRIQKTYPEITLLQTGKNLGFSRGYNIGIRFALAHNPDYVLMVNNDTILHPDMLSQLVEYDDQSVGCLSPAIFFADQPERIWSQGGKISPITYEITDNHGRNIELPDHPVDRDFLSGCCLLIRRQALETVGLLDEDFFLYYEDQDFSLRVRQHGYRLVLVPQARLWHKVSISSGGTDSPGERYWMGHSSVLFFRKHIRGIRWLYVIPWRLASSIKTVLRLLFDQKPGAALAYLKGEWDGLVQKL
jgi:GT2 family glycosyltransferase